MIYPFSISGLSAIAFSLVVLLGSCRSASVNHQLDAEMQTPQARSTSTSSVSLELTPGAGQEQQPQPLSSQATATPNYTANVSPLDPATLDQIEAELGPKETLIRDQTFAINPPETGDTLFLAFVASRVNEARGQERLALRWRFSQDDYIPLLPPEATKSWTFWDLKAVSFLDANADGAGPDVIVIAEYITGMGPTGAQPFPYATVYLNTGNDYFATDPDLDKRLNEQNAATIDEVKAILQAEW